MVDEPAPASQSLSHLSAGAVPVLSIIAARRDSTVVIEIVQ